MAMIRLLYPEGSAIAKMLEAIPIEEAVAGIVPKGEATEEIVPGEDTAEEIVPGGEKTTHTMIWLGVLIGAGRTFAPSRGLTGWPDVTPPGHPEQATPVGAPMRTPAEP